MDPYGISLDSAWSPSATPIDFYGHFSVAIWGSSMAPKESRKRVRKKAPPPSVTNLCHEKDAAGHNFVEQENEAATST